MRQGWGLMGLGDMGAHEGTWERAIWGGMGMHGNAECFCVMRSARLVTACEMRPHPCPSLKSVPYICVYANTDGTDVHPSGGR